MSAVSVRKPALVTKAVTKYTASAFGLACFVYSIGVWWEFRKLHKAERRAYEEWALDKGREPRCAACGR